MWILLWVKRRRWRVRNNRVYTTWMGPALKGRMPNGSGNQQLTHWAALGTGLAGPNE